MTGHDLINGGSRAREKRSEKPCGLPLSPVPYGANIQPVAIKSEINSFRQIDQKFTADNSILNMLVCDEDWNPFLCPPWQTEGEMACPPAQACWQLRTWRWGCLCKHSPFSKLKWFCFSYQAAVSEANKKGLLSQEISLMTCIQTEIAVTSGLPLLM